MEDDDEGRKTGADHIQEERAPGEGLLSRLPGMAYQCRDDTERIMEFASVGSREVTGYEPEALLGSGEGPDYGELIHPEDQDRVRKRVRAAVEEDRPFEVEYRIRTRWGETRRVWERGHPVRDGDGQLLGLEGFISDITPHHRTSQELRRSMEMLRTLVEQDLFGVYVIQEGRFRFVNGTLARIFGYERSEIVDRLGPGDLVAEADRETVVRNVARRERGEPPSLRYRFTGVRKDGTEVPVEVHGTRAVLHGEPAVSGVLLDVSERRELRHQLQEVQKREALAELTGAVAHDFNNFLTGIIGALDLAALNLDALDLGDPDPDDSDAPLDAGVREEIASARNTAERAVRLIRQLLTFSQDTVDQPRTFDARDVLGEMESLLGQLVGSPMSLEMSVAAEPLWVHLDPGHLEQVIMNLVLNARDAMPEGGKVVLRLSAARGGGPEDGGTGARDGNEGAGASDDGAGERVVLEVADDGPGMSEEVREEIFLPFFTTKESGTGLGLATVRRVVEDADGEVTVRSAPGEGATFRVSLPAAAEPAEEPRSRTDAGAGEASAGAGARVLVVEDDDAVRRLARTILRRNDFEAHAVRSAAAALEFLEGSDPPPALLLTDVSLPDEDGVRLAARVREIHPEIRILFASGYAPEEWPGNTPPEGSTFLEKPFSVDDLLEAVREALEG